MKRTRANLSAGVAVADADDMTGIRRTVTSPW